MQTALGETEEEITSFAIKELTVQLGKNKKRMSPDVPSGEQCQLAKALVGSRFSGPSAFLKVETQKGCHGHPRLDVCVERVELGSGARNRIWKVGGMMKI